MKTELRKEAERQSKEAREFAEFRIKGIRQTLEGDMEAGRRDARVGIYDKWYREHHQDAGRAYQAGWMLGRCELEEAGIELGKVTFI